MILEYSPLAQRLHVPQTEGLERRGLLECPPHYLAHPVDIHLAQRAVGVEKLVGGRGYPGGLLRYPELPQGVDRIALLRTTLEGVPIVHPPPVPALQRAAQQLELLDIAP